MDSFIPMSKPRQRSPLARKRAESKILRMTRRFTSLMPDNCPTMLKAPLLPVISTDDSFTTYVANAEAGLEAAREIAKRHALPGNVERFPTGAMLVFRVGDSQVIKLYPAMYVRKYAVEKASLRMIENQLPIPTPTIVADGEIDEWSYLAMTLLHGTAIDTMFNDIDPTARTEIHRVLGKAVAQLHALRIPHDSPLMHNWDDYVTARLNGAVDRQRRLGLDERYVAQIPQFLSRFERDLRTCQTPVLLHTELGPSHVLVERKSKTWSIGGLFDFGDAFAGPAEFEFPGVALFVARGDRALFREFLQSYGSAFDSTDKTGPFHERMLAYALIHKYSNLAWYRKEVPVNVVDPSLESLAMAWFDVSSDDS